MQNVVGAWWVRAGSALRRGAAQWGLGALALAACSPHTGPSAAAVEAYVGQRGTEEGRAQPPDAAAPTAPGTAADTTGGAASDAGPAGAAAGSPGPGTRLAKRLRVTVVSGEGLPDTDAGPGETDPYVVLDYEGERFKTSVADGTLEPVWGDSFVLDVRPGAVLGFTLMDRDAWSSDEKLGVVNDPLPPVHVGETVELDVAFRGGAFGTVRVTLLGLD